VADLQLWDEDLFGIAICVICAWYRAVLSSFVLVSSLSSIWVRSVAYFRESIVLLRAVFRLLDPLLV
jgi:hypothetical protein